MGFKDFSGLVLYCLLKSVYKYKIQYVSFVIIYKFRRSYPCQSSSETNIIRAIFSLDRHTVTSVIFFFFFFFGGGGGGLGVEEAR